ncbi:MAG TPA: hypothetical protein VGH19_06795 [Verrucomicrobiae bacterium]
MKTIHKFLPGTTFIPLSRKDRCNHTVTDVLTTTDLSGKIHHIRYVATHPFLGQTVTESNVIETTIERGLVQPVFNPEHPSQSATRFADIFTKMDAIGMPAELKPFVESGVLDPHIQHENGSLVFYLTKHSEDNEIITLTWFPADARPGGEIPFDLYRQLYRDKNCTNPVGTESLEPTTLEELIDYLETLPE